MVQNGIQFLPKTPPFYCCKICDYTTSINKDYKKHLQTIKHRKGENGIKMVSNGIRFVPENPQQFTCECGNAYKYRSGYYRHKKICTITFINNDDKPIDAPTEITPELVLKILEQNKELTNVILQQNKTITDLSKNTNSHTINSHNTNSNNKTFNLQVFLNETCKDALNINDFVNSIKMTLEDLEYTGRKGYSEGITNIILKNLNGLEVYDRPIHCSDLKREILYIKHNDTWNKEEVNNPVFTNAIKNIANENIKQITKWKQENPDCTDSDSKKNNLYLKIVSNSMCGSDKEETTKNMRKIVSNVSKEVVINKK
jgi:hypothetical protein